MLVHIVLYSICSELGFSDPKILGVFESEQDALKCKKELCEKELINNYRTFIFHERIKYYKRDSIISDDIKNGYEVA